MTDPDRKQKPDKQPKAPEKGEPKDKKGDGKPGKDSVTPDTERRSKG